MSATDVRDPIIGCLLGGAIGDAWGAAYEGASPPFAVDCESPWFLTDDTQLTLATCDAIVECDGRVEPEAIAAQFVRLFRNNAIVGIGASTYKALSELAAGGHWALVGRRGEFAAGNGAAMRIAPLAFRLDPDTIESRRVIRDVCRITHHNDEAYVGALAVILAIQAAFNRRWWGGPEAIEPIVRNLPDSRVRDRLSVLGLEHAGRDLCDLSDEFGSSGYVVDSVPLAITAASRLNQLGFRRMLHEVVSCGGDTDTMASIAGQIAGAVVEFSGLPTDLLNRLPDYDAIYHCASRFATVVGQDPTG